MHPKNRTTTEQRRITPTTRSEFVGQETPRVHRSATTVWLDALLAISEERREHLRAQATAAGVRS